MSEYDFSFGDQGLGPTAGEQGQDGGQDGNGLRQYLKEISGQLKDLKAENDRLRDERRTTEVADALKAKGFAPHAAELYTGTPDKLDDWLGTHGAALAKLPADGQEQQAEQLSGPPATVVPADGQAALQRMQEAGTQGASAPQGSDKELAAAIAACKTEEEYGQLMRAHGNQHEWNV